MAKKDVDFTQTYTPTNKREEQQQAPSTKMSSVDIKSNVSVKHVGALGRLWNDLRHRDWRALKETTLEDVVIPGLMDLAADGLHALVDRFIYKDDVRTYRRRTSVFSSDGSQSYGYWKSSQQAANRRPNAPQTSNNAISYAELVFTGPHAKMDVQSIIDEMARYSHMYQESGVTIPKLYEFIEESLRVSGNKDYKEVMSSLKRLEYTDTKYGWDEDDIRSARPMRVGGGGFVLDLPTPKYLD